MIIINPILTRCQDAKFSKEFFPHLFNEHGQEVFKTYIYTEGENIVVESVEDAQTIQEKTRDFIRRNICKISQEIAKKHKLLNAFQATL